MIQRQPILTNEAIDAFNKRTGHQITTSVFDGNQCYNWHILPLFTIIADGLMRTDEKIEF